MKIRNIKSAAVFVVTIVALYGCTIAVFLFALRTEYVPTDKFAELRLVVLLLFMPIIVKYVLHLFIAPIYPLVEYVRMRRQKKVMTPTISVLIPAWNEEVGIIATLSSVIKTHYPALEIIIVNDGSTDNTHEVITKFISSCEKEKNINPVSIQYRSVPNGGKGRALNVALSLATGEIIATIDADSIMDQNALTNFVKHYSDPEVASVAGNVAIGNKRKTVGLIQQLEYLYGFYFKRADSLMNAVYIVGGAAATYRSSVIKAIGGFDENSITEDIELSTRLQDLGYKVRYAVDAIVYTEGPSTFEDLCKQRLRWKFGRLQTFFKYRHLFFSVKKEHNQYLTFLVLPIALFAEILLFFEGILLTIFYTYTFYTHDFAPLVFVITLLTTVVCVQIISDPKTRYHSNLFILAPGAWILFYVMDFVEYQALLRTLKKLVFKQKPEWQKWKRLGVFQH